ncbi:uncharacterized protein I303_101573 [Kwoniella dejecticola CBS 10117]|uniref:Uncharacterized protein n=1 Tax=Kwoniella dejecticola CBS 10117 TaxID=1296121 RepID=A0A1A6ADE3_9TREE|nr:uncharacterized protein I303_02294 [Kwoniella dejecticola CBS 10117]OBR88075.1 hypothetical protein I303_02294 [Kwoniella dejecticola CBS 10117]
MDPSYDSAYSRPDRSQNRYRKTLHQLLRSSPDRSNSSDADSQSYDSTFSPTRHKSYDTDELHFGDSSGGRASPIYYSRSDEDESSDDGHSGGYHGGHSAEYRGVFPSRDETPTPDRRQYLGDDESLPGPSAGYQSSFYHIDTSRGASLSPPYPLDDEAIARSILESGYKSGPNNNNSSELRQTYSTDAWGYENSPSGSRFDDYSGDIQYNDEEVELEHPRVQRYIDDRAPSWVSDLQTRVEDPGYSLKDDYSSPFSSKDSGWN